MNKIYSNKTTHHITCKVCSETMYQVPCEEWANVAEENIDFAIEDNHRMEQEWEQQWLDDVENFKNKHLKCDPSGFNF